MNLASLKTKIKSGELDTVLLAAPDVFGRLVGKRFTAPFFLDHVLKDGTHVCNYLLAVNIEMDPLDGFKLANWERGFGDFALRPDFTTLRRLPWQPGTVMLLGDLHHSGGALVEEAPRTVLRRQIEFLDRKGYRCCIASELEFYLFNQTYHAAFQAGYQNLSPASDYRIDYHTMQPTRDEALMRAARQGMCEAGVPVECSKGEWGKGQHEINFTYDQPMAMADKHVVFKQGIKEIAEQHGKAITFMAKYAATEAGNSCHIHISLWRERTNLFWDAKRQCGSKLYRQFLGGLMRYSPELSYCYAPTINSYKRYQAGSWAPTKMAWSTDNRTVGFRIVGQGDSFRIENRMPGADANPYLAFAAMLAAGMAGVEEDLDCGDEYVGNAYLDAKLPALPASLDDAAERLNRSQLARQRFGDAVVDFYTHTARLEVQAFNGSVTDWERARYFERI
jgi:glutamine synthetase